MSVDEAAWQIEIAQGWRDKHNLPKVPDAEAVRRHFNEQWYFKGGGLQMDGLTEGRIVHFVLPNGEHRPAMVVKVWNKETGYVNLQVFTDGPNDLPAYEGSNWSDDMRKAVRSGVMWATSIFPDETSKRGGSWHWIEKA